MTAAIDRPLTGRVYTDSVTGTRDGIWNWIRDTSHDRCE